jgi:hypothetical protein
MLFNFERFFRYMLDMLNVISVVNANSFQAKKAGLVL